MKLPKKRKEIKEDFEKEQLKHDDTKRLLYAIRLGWGLVIIVLCLYVSAFFISGCKSNTKSNHVIIGYQEIALYRHLFTAIERGYFDQEKVKVEVRPFVSANQMIQAMIAGKLDATGLSNMEVALSVESKDPDRFELVNMLVWKDNSFPDYILARKGSDIDSLKQLEGHVVGLHPGSAVRGFSKAVLEYFGLDLSGISFLELKPAIMQSSVSAGRVDGVYCMDPVATTLVETGEAHVLVANPLKYIFAPPIPISGTALSKILINERPDDARKIIRALEKAIIYMRQPGHEDEIAGYIAKYTPISPEMSLKMNDSEYWTTEEIDRERIQALADKFIELEIIDKAVEITNIMIPKDFLEKK
ncbi:MAG: ABC transporter substrate-binding protein [Candidatus Electryonea clarkiae]|nr:ABC transporter substrate-binding protein [Candidatus Electryonea clarkiae]